MRIWITWVYFIGSILRDIFAPNQRSGKSIWMVWIIKTETPLYAEPIFISGPILTLNIQNFIIFNMIFYLTPNATIWTQAIYLFVRFANLHLIIIQQI